MASEVSVQVIQNPELFENLESQDVEDIVDKFLSLKKRSDEEIIVLVPPEKFSFFSRIRENGVIWDLYLNGILLFSAKKYEELKQILPKELLNDAVVLKAKTFYKTLIRELIELESQELLTDILEIKAEDKLGVRSMANIARLLAQTKLKVEPGWLNLIKNDVGYKIIGLILIEINKKKVPLVVEVESFSRKPTKEEVKNILKQFLVKFVELIVKKKSASVIEVKTFTGSYKLKDLTKEVGRTIVILSDEGKVIKTFENLEVFRGKKLRFLKIRGGPRYGNRFNYLP